MNWTEYVASVSAASVLVGGIVGAVVRSWADSRASDRKDNLDQLQLALATIGKLEARADIQGGQIHNLGTRIEGLLVANTRLELENRGLRIDITTLQNQLKSLGHTPAFAEDVAAFCCDPTCPLAASKAKAAAVAVASNNVQGDGK